MVRAARCRPGSPARQTGRATLPGMSHTGRGVLVTGASRGVGAATARAFAARGDRVVVHYRGARERAEAVLAGLDGEGHALLGADLADPTAGAAARGRRGGGPRPGRRAGQQRGDVRRLPVAGSRRVGHPLADTPYEEWVDIWARTLATNLLGPANLTWCVARQHDRGAAGGRPTGRPDRQRRLPRRVPRRAGRPGVRREQGRPARDGLLARGRPRQPRHRGGHAGAGLHRQRDGGAGAGGPGR